MAATVADTDDAALVIQYLESVRENRGLPATPTISVPVAVANLLIQEEANAVERARELELLVRDDYNDLKHRNRRQSDMITSASLRHKTELEDSTACALAEVQTALESKIHHAEHNGFQIEHHGGSGVHAPAVPVTHVRAAIEGARARLGLPPDEPDDAPQGEWIDPALAADIRAAVARRMLNTDQLAAALAAKGWRRGSVPR